MKVTYWSDYACPFCYIGETNLKKALKELGLEDVEIEMKAFELDPNASTKADTDIAQLMAEKYAVSLEQALNQIKSIAITAKEAGIENFDYSKARSSNTFNAHRLTKLAKEKGLEDEVAENLFKAYFVDHEVLADAETLINAAEKAGLDRKEVEDLLNSDKYADEVRIDEIIARQNGINAVPFFVIDDKYGIPGALPVENMKEVLTETIKA